MEIVHGFFTLMGIFGVAFFLTLGFFLGRTVARKISYKFFDGI